MTTTSRAERRTTTHLKHPDTKLCSVCGRDLPLEDFALDRSRPDGRQRRCKGCSNAARRVKQPDNLRNLPEDAPPITGDPVTEAVWHEHNDPPKLACGCRPCLAYERDLLESLRD